MVIEICSVFEQESRLRRCISRSSMTLLCFGSRWGKQCSCFVVCGFSFLGFFSWNILTWIVLLWTLFTFFSVFFFLLCLVAREGIEKESVCWIVFGLEKIKNFHSVEYSTRYGLVWFSWVSRFLKTETTWHLLILSFGLDNYSSDSWNPKGLWVGFIEKVEIS